MCTVFTFLRDNLYFGRNMDIEYHFGEKVVITPRDFPITTRRAGMLSKHYAIIGMANVTDNYPLYAEAVNEKGLCMAGLNFPQNAYYVKEKDANKTMITPFELIPYVLGKCASLQDAKELIQNIDIVDIPFSQSMPLAPLHWIVSDREGSITIECTARGMNIYDNKYGVLTNNPEYPFHEENIRQYMHLSPKNATNNFCTNVDIAPFGQGMGAIGLPGDFSPASRFVKTVFCKANSKCDNDEMSCVSQVMHILDSVAMVKGSVVTETNLDDVTIYSSCINASLGIYYYKTYTNNQITKIELTKERKEGDKLTIFPLRTNEQIYTE